MNPKSDEETMLLPVNRRAFLYGAAVSAGAVLLWNSCSGVQSTRDKDTLQVIKAIMEKEPSDPADVQLLKEILLPWHGAESLEVVVAAARALALQADFFVIPTYKELFITYYDNSTYVKHFIPLLVLNFAVNPPARLKITYFLYRIAVQLAPQATLRPVYLPNWAKAQAGSAQQLIGNMTLRGWLIKLHNAQTTSHRSEDSLSAEKEFLSGIEAIDASFKGQAYSPENTELWKAQLASGSDEDKISALRNLHRVSFLNSELLLGILKNASLKLQKSIVPIIGNNIAFTPEVQAVMLDYLDGNDDHLVIAAAKALRFKENLPAKDIAKILERHRNRDTALGQQLDAILLSTLVSEDDALADVFTALVKNMFITKPANKMEKMKRITEIRIWYWRLSLNRNHYAIYPYGKSSDMDILEYSADVRNERNNRNDRARLAMPSVPPDIQDLFIAFLRQIPAIPDPIENYYKDRFAHDLKDLYEIYEELSSRRILFLSEANGAVRKGLIVAAARFGNALSERPSMDTDGKTTPVIGFVRRWSATKAAANNDNGANLGFEAEFTQSLKFQ